MEDNCIKLLNGTFYLICLILTFDYYLPRYEKKNRIKYKSFDDYLAGKTRTSWGHRYDIERSEVMKKLWLGTAFAYSMNLPSFIRYFLFVLLFIEAILLFWIKPRLT